MMEEQDIFGNITGADYHTEQMDQHLIAGAALLDDECEEGTHRAYYYQAPDHPSDDSDGVAFVLAVALLAFFGWLTGYALVQAF